VGAPVTARLDTAAVPSRGTTAVPREELDRILRAHELFLSHSGKGTRADLSSRHLASVDFSNRALAEAEFTGSDLCRANLRFANLTGANFYCCEMRNVDARYANFTHADMRGVTLNGSNLSHARLDHVDFRAGRLMKSGAEGGEAVIDRNGSARGVDLSFCSLSCATFEGADLNGADFTGAIITATKFKGARLAGAVFTDAVLSEVDISEIPLPPSAFAQCVLPPTAAAVAAKPHLMFRLNAHQRWVESNARMGTCAVFDGEDLRPLATAIGKFKLTAISAKNVIAAGVDFSCTELQGANFDGADLRGANFEGSDLRGVKFARARLHHARFLGADMRPLALKTGGTLPCDLTGVELTAEQRAEAIFA
jgi:uncharacterized protein YjbI with pentapeptide repeats